MIGTDEAIENLMADTGMDREEATLAYRARVARAEAGRVATPPEPVYNRAQRRAAARGKRA